MNRPTRSSLVISTLSAAVTIAVVGSAACGGPVAFATPNGSCTQVGESASIDDIDAQIEVSSEAITLSFDGGAIGFFEFLDADGETLYYVACQNYLDSCIESPLTLGEVPDRATDGSEDPGALRGAGEASFRAERYDSSRSCDVVARTNTTFTL